MEEEVKNGQSAADVETVSDKENFNDNLHGENLTERAKVLSPGMTVLKRFFRSKLSVIGLVVLIALFLFSFIGPLFSPWGANEADVKSNINFTVTTIPYEVDGEIYYCYDVTLDETTYNILGGISSDHIMGTDDSGYDVFTRLMKGGQVSLTIGFVVVILETLLGVLLGGLAGYFGKWVDQLIMRIVDVLSCIPTLPILLILSAIFESLKIVDISKLYYMMIVLTLLGWTSVARLVRGQILSLREQEFMLAAKSSGLSTAKKIFKHLLPNVIPQLIVFMTLGLGSIILYEATLGYLGIGAPLGTATWGNLINMASNATYRNFYPNLWLGSGICITLAILAFNFVGDGLRDAFDPKMKR
ncbi:MAG: ABC transporter permease [Clostridia bacterium]|nr:ABC transporter permease [Clostridia bacterium]MDE7265180.1 ABC transporter permease [Clostridia bacterium]